MYSLTIHFGPNAICWAFLFKEKERAQSIQNTIMNREMGTSIQDDFGQQGFFEKGSIHGHLLEDLDLVEAARIQRALAEERCKVKLMAAAKVDPVIRQAMQGGPQVLQPRFND